MDVESNGRVQRAKEGMNSVSVLDAVSALARWRADNCHQRALAPGFSRDGQSLEPARLGVQADCLIDLIVVGLLLLWRDGIGDWCMHGIGIGMAGQVHLSIPFCSPLRFRFLASASTYPTLLRYATLPYRNISTKPPLPPFTLTPDTHAH